jgi:hypothetical protein
VVVTSELRTTPAVTSRKMEVNQGQAETQAVKRSSTVVVDVPAARSSYAKDREHPSSGRSPGSWLQALLILPSHSMQNGGWLSSSRGDESLTSYSSA